jgi:hypothetical protein
VKELAENVAFPVYVLAKDCGDVMGFPSARAMQAYMEPINVENSEYEAWDSTGYHLRLSVSKPKSVWLKIAETEDRASDQEFTALRERAKAYLEPEPFLRSLRRRLGWLRAKGLLLNADFRQIP